jgi:hypothetical protein
MARILAPPLSHAKDCFRNFGRSDDLRAYGAPVASLFESNASVDLASDMTSRRPPSSGRLPEGLPGTISDE